MRSSQEFAEEVIEKRFAFLTPNQMPLLENGSFDVAINIDSFGEMAPSSVKNYCSFIANNLSQGGVVYFRNMGEGMNYVDSKENKFLPPKLEDYGLGDQFVTSLLRSWPLQPWYFEMIAKKTGNII